MIKAVLFDLDGTLVNSLGDLAASTNFALLTLGYPAHQTECFRYFVGDGMIKLIERALPKEKCTDENISKCHKIFMEHYRTHYCDTTYIYEGVCDLLNALKEKGLKLAVISNKADSMAKEVVSKLFGNAFDIVTGKREEYPTKPDATLTLKIIDELGVKPDECVFLGDSGMDMLTAKNSGALPVGVLWGFRERQELLQNGAEQLLSKPEELLEIL